MNSFKRGFIGAYLLAKGIIFESAAILVGMIFLPYLWLLSYRATFGVLSYEEKFYFHKLKIEIQRHDQQWLPHVTAILWVGSLLILELSYWVQGEIPQLLSWLILWLGLLLITTGYMRHLARKM